MTEKNGAFDFPEEPRKWDQPIARPAASLSLVVWLNAYQWQVYYSIPNQAPVPTHGEFISKLLDSKVQITDASIGRVLYETTLMELAFQRIRAAGLGRQRPPAFGGYVCPLHPGFPHEEGSLACEDMIQGAGVLITGNAPADGHLAQPIPGKEEECSICHFAVHLHVNEKDS